jgi:hypothetical protein
MQTANERYQAELQQKDEEIQQTNIQLEQLHYAQLGHSNMIPCFPFPARILSTITKFCSL